MVGASAVLANGSIMSRAGSATVCMMSHFRKIPVIVLTETYKFSDVTRLDSIAWNELGSQNEVCEYSRGKLDNWKEQSNLNIINLNYDLTPSEFITMVYISFTTH